MKTCPGCGETKDIAEFHRDSHAASGYRSRCKTCSKQVSRDYYVANTEAKKKSSAEWRASNRERWLRASMSWYADNKDRAKANFKQWRRDNPERDRALRSAATAKVRAAKALTSERFDPLEVLKRDNWRCHLCGVHTPRRLRGTFADNAPELDHIIPLSAGGEHSARNTACACRKCNRAKSAKPLGQLRMFG